jgi:cellulose synthase/poly-beta-1,6-N-acetylglucosamine synthase-like glycosyltransferase
MAVDISIIIPTYKRPGYLFRCLEALWKQDMASSRYEVIVVCDGPDAETVFMMEGTNGSGPAFELYLLPEKRGPAAARNAGWKRAIGELILFTDDDCIPSPSWVSSYWAAYESYKGQERLGWIFGESLAFRGPLSVPCPKRPTDHEKNTTGLERAEFVTANCGCTPAALKAIGGFDESFTMAWREDSDLEFKLLEQKIPIINISGAGVTHPVRQAPWGISLKEQKKSLFNALLYKKHPVLFRRKIYRFPFWNYYLMIFLLLAAVIALVGSHGVVAAIAGAGWLLMTLGFTAKRLKGASLSFSHILEMLLTSMLIPFLSVYWTIYGAIRYKIFFL